MRQKPLIEEQAVVDSRPNSTREEITRTRHILSRFGFTENQVTKPISLLSPGERSRLILAQLVVTRPNCIILDEPSNHLDIEALEALEDAGVRTRRPVVAVAWTNEEGSRFQPGAMGSTSRADSRAVQASTTASKPVPSTCQ